ncbi:MAG: cell division protein FtsA, partial [Nonlabens sp.]
REPKEITLKNLSKIIHARVIEILETVFVEIKNYGHEEPKKQLIAGVVLTGGGSQLKHIKQLAEYVTGMPSRIGYPNEHLAGGSDTENTSPLFATAVGLVMKGLEAQLEEVVEEEEEVEPVVEVVEEIVEEEEEVEEEIIAPQEPKSKGIFDTWATKFKDFLDKAE